MTDPIKAKIQELCPDVMALPEYPYNPDAAKAIVAFEKIAGRTLWNSELQETATMYIENYRQQQAGDYRAMLEGRYEGRPITLAVVMRAIDKESKSHGLPSEVGYPNITTNIQTWRDERWMEMLYAWNLEHDNYDAQSEETKDFIGNLLNV